ncbi:holo-[acyl-carrier-protein] synthase [Planomonospora venezuelensis]|nr:holo-[acyl-carrier-protein] synthase [Planomonospora venezuelensis]
MGGSTQVRGTVGTGTDIVSVARIAALHRSAGDRFLRRWFTDDEIDYCTSRARPELHLAARMAAKEAVLKALRPTGDAPLAWRSIEIARDVDGAPSVRLVGDVRTLAESRGAGAIHVSLSHCDEYAVAVAVADSAAG